MDKIEVIKNKLIDIENIKSKLAYWRFLNKKIVFTNGCFDILHLGHIKYLSEAANMGDILIIGLNSDSSVKKIKGNGRPINNQDSRSMLLASLFFVDSVIIFDEETPADLIEKIKPDILVKGNDYKENEIVGADIVKRNNGKVVTVELVEGYSSSNIINKVKDN